jgi:transposase
MEKQIIYYYQRGIASYQIAKHFGVSNTYVRNLLKKSGITLRGHETTNKMSARRRSPEQNKEITRKASEANLGSVHTPTHRARLALSRQLKPSIDPVYEQPL